MEFREWGCGGAAVVWRVEYVIPTIVPRKNHDRIVAQPQFIKFVEQHLEIAVKHLEAICDDSTI